MAPGLGYCSTFMRSLELDDWQGIEALYPAVAANPPSVRIVTPASGATFAAGSVVTLTGTAQDAEDGDLTRQIEWSSSVQGWLGNGGSVSASLSSGSHTLTARVLDSQGLTGTSERQHRHRQSRSGGIVVWRDLDRHWAKGEAATEDRSCAGRAGRGRRWISIGTGPGERRWRTPGRIPTASVARAADSYTYYVCNSTTTDCSNTVVITF